MFVRKEAPVTQPASTARAPNSEVMVFEDDNVDIQPDSNLKIELSINDAGGVDTATATVGLDVDRDVETAHHGTMEIQTADQDTPLADNGDSSASNMDSELRQDAVTADDGLSMVVSRDNLDLVLLAGYAAQARRRINTFANLTRQEIALMVPAGYAAQDSRRNWIELLGVGAWLTTGVDNTGQFGPIDDEHSSASSDLIAESLEDRMIERANELFAEEIQAIIETHVDDQMIPDGAMDDL